MGISLKIHDFLSEEFHYTEFQIKQLRYFFLCILSESSKIVLMGLFFYFTGHIKEFLFATIVLCILRSCTGGIHLKHYITCFMMSFGFLFLGVSILPIIPTNRLIQMLLLLLCIAANEYAAPVVSCYRPVPDGLRIRKSKIKAAVIISLYIVILYIIPENPYTTAGFWIIILQSAQLVAAKLWQRRERNEITCQKVDVYNV